MKDGGAAFPQIEIRQVGDSAYCLPTKVYHLGMSKRDYLLGKVLQGFCANPAVFAHNGMTGWALVNCTEEVLVNYALRIVDIALAERSK